MQNTKQVLDWDNKDIFKRKREFYLDEDLVDKLDSIEYGAQVNKIEEIEVNWVPMEPDESKTVHLNIPRVIDSVTSNSSTDALSAWMGRYLFRLIDEWWGWGWTWMRCEVVTELPEEWENWVIYLISHWWTVPDLYDEYIWLSISRTFEKIWTTEIDLSRYVTTNTTQTITWAKTFSIEPSLPNKTTPVTNNWTKPATEAQVYAVDNNSVKLTWNQTISWTKTFNTSPIVPNKTTDATNSWTSIATEAQVYNVAQDLNSKQDALTAWEWITIENNVISSTPWKQAFFKTQTEYDALPSSKNSDGNLYIIVDNHVQTYTWEELESMWASAASDILNSDPQWYADYYLDSWDVQTRDFVSSRNEDNPWHQLPTSIYIIEYKWDYNNWWQNCNYEYYKTDATIQDLENLINSWYGSLAQQILSWTRYLDCLR